MDIVRVNWSGGKDSTCAVIKHLQLGHCVKAVCYIPMFDGDIPLITRAHYNHIMKTAQKFRAWGAEVHIVHGISYVEYCTHRAKLGKYRGLMFGYPSINRGQCGFKRDSKIKACNSVDIGYYDYEDIGIAYDEWHRKGQLNDKKRSILNELGITELEARDICVHFGMLSPLYAASARDGCVLCPYARQEEREVWFLDYPQAKQRLINLQNLLMIERPDRFPLRGYKYFL